MHAFVLRAARGAAVAAVAVLASPLLASDNKPHVSVGVIEAIGNTPLIEISSLSRATGCRILAKAEHLNPGGSVKDRPARNIILEYEKEGKLVPRHLRKENEAPGIIIEATGGNTGLGMALVAAARGYRCIFTMPASISSEKIELMKTLGAEVITCPAVPFASPEHYYQRALALVQTTPGAVLGNQFEGLNNMRAHYLTTGPEIWAQTGGKVDAVAVAAGTGGTIGGLSTFLKEKNPHIKVRLHR
jgi:cysteine synthase A